MCPPRVCRRVALKSFFCCRRIPFNVESCGIAREQIICLADNATIFGSRSDNANGQKWHKLTKQPIVVVFVGRLCLFFSVAFVFNRLAAAGCKFLSHHLFDQSFHSSTKKHMIGIKINAQLLSKEHLTLSDLFDLLVAGECRSGVVVTNMWLHYVAAAATTNRPPPSSGLTPVATWGWLEASARCSAALPAVRGRGSSSKPPPRPLRQKPPQLENMAKHKYTSQHNSNTNTQ